MAFLLRHLYCQLAATQSTDSTTRLSPDLRRYCAALTTLILIGCNGEEIPTGHLNGNTIDLGIPEKIRSVSAVNLDNVTAIANVTIDDNPSVDHDMIRSGNRFQSTIKLQNATSVAVNLRFHETLDNGHDLNLARHTQVSRSVGNNNITMEFLEENFDTERYDDDGDSISNLKERALGTDPLVFSPIVQNRELILNFTLPANIPNPLVTQSIVTFSGTPRALSRNGTTFTATGTIDTLADVPVEVLLTQQVTSGRVVLAVSTSTVTSGFEDFALTLSDNDFNFSRDDDGDGQTNIEEVRNNTNPFSAN